MFGGRVLVIHLTDTEFLLVFRHVLDTGDTARNQRTKENPYLRILRSNEEKQTQNK
jgi:hypothetical protein